MYSLSSLFIQLPILKSSCRNAVFPGNALTTNTSQNYSHIQLKRAAETTLGGYDVGLNQSSLARTQESIKCDATYRMFDVNSCPGAVNDKIPTARQQVPSSPNSLRTPDACPTPNTLYHGQFLSRSKGRFYFVLFSSMRYIRLRSYSRMVDNITLYPPLRGTAVSQWLWCCATKSVGRSFDSRWCHWNFSLI